MPTAGAAEGAISGASGAKAADAVSSRHNVPARLTSFVGRERELAEVVAQVLAARLVTLVGAPGVGKTRLSLQSALGMLEAFPDGVWLVELAPLADPDLVPHVVADVLGVREQPGRTLTVSLAGYLRTRRMLLVLDNCEHLIIAAATLAETLLQACPNLHVLATSREPLTIEGEVTHRVPSLSVPDLRGEKVASLGSTPPPALASFEAVQLFVERARAASPTFALTERNATLIGQICARLDGIPLAIELAAARVRTLSVEQIAARLDDRFRLLTGGSRTALPRQQTLRGAVEWSYDLLSEPERTVLRRLAVFAGGFSLEAVDAVAADHPDESQVTVLLSLVDKSLVQVEGEAGGERRYWLLETFRQYGQEQLIAHGELSQVRDRHRDYFLAFTEEIAPTLRERPDSVVLDRIEREHDNLRAALGWCLERASLGGATPLPAGMAPPANAAVLGVRLAAAIWRFWWLRGHIGEGRRWLTRVLAAPSADTSPASLSARATALSGISNLASFQGDHRAAVAHTTENLAFCRATGNDSGVATSLNRLGYFLAHLGEAERGMALCMEGVVLARQAGNPVILASALHSAGQVARMSGRSEQSITLSDEAIGLFRELGNLPIMAYAMSNKSHALADLGDAAQAQALAEDGLRIFREVGDPRGIAQGFKDLARFALFAGDADRAIAPLRRALELFRSLGDLFMISICLDILAGVAISRARPILSADAADQAQNDGSAEHLLDAARLYAWADLMREQSGLDPPPEMRGDPERNVTLLRERLGDEPFSRAWAEGRAMSWEQAVAYAVAITATADADASTTTSSPVESTLTQTSDPDAVRLTPREREVAVLIVQGRTNREIAEALVLSERTVDSHIRNIMGKLEVNSRAQIAAWTVQHAAGSPR